MFLKKRLVLPGLPVNHKGENEGQRKTTSLDLLIRIYTLQNYFYREVWHTNIVKDERIRSKSF